MARPQYEVQPEWVHVAYAEPTVGMREVYGFAGGQGVTHLEGIRFAPKGVPAKTLLVYMHPASTLQLLPMPRAIAEHGVHVLCAGSRYQRNDTPLIMENVIIDLGAYVRHAKTVWGYEKVVICGWSGGGSLSLFYQSQAEHPTITHTPAGDPLDIKSTKLIPADAMIVQAAHVSRAVLMREWIDPSVKDEHNPDDRTVELDLYDPRNPNKPPYSKDYLAHFRAAQLARVRRKTAYAKDTLAMLKKRGTNEVERGFITHRTVAEPRFLDATLDPNDRKIAQCFLGHPETANTGPVGVGRFSTCRAWLSQWSIDDSNAIGDRCAERITVPLLAIENSADDAVPQPHTALVYNAAASKDKTMHVIRHATHYYVEQPELLQTAVDLCIGWMRSRGFE